MSADLAADRQPGVYSWNLTLKTALPNRQDSVTASLNALTGEMLSFDYYPVAGGWQWGYLNRAGAQKISAGFLQAIQPQRFTEAKLEQGFSPAPAWGIKCPPFQQFNYRRMVNGIPFPANYLAVGVDTHARRVVRYELKWTNLSFPAPRGAMSLQQANGVYLGNYPLNLLYVRDENTGAISGADARPRACGNGAGNLLDPI